MVDALFVYGHVEIAEHWKLAPIYKGIEKPQLDIRVIVQRSDDFRRFVPLKRILIVDQKADLPVDLEQIDIKALLNIFGQRNVMYNNGKFDITAEVLAKVDANYKARK